MNKILYEDDDTEDYLDSILLNPVALTISKWRTFKFQRWAHISTDWWIWMKFCMEMMTLKVTLAQCYLIS
jgi:hypothetical protein